ncbi:hypothetical protein TSUD_318290 [Trifolium subterraneum]|uniref:Uncharacterized protein n=1 Tax=Trifolium subterraneum TaxID=3900 RepID=A0A2Z6MZ25_TRISU|nr:hypothetical protein TSUD_318290 [Trifolium subterraneum]
MASSSRSYQLQTKSTKEFNCFKEEKAPKALQEEEEEEEEEKDKEEDWLKLGLGLGSSTSSWKKIVPNPTLVSSSSSSSQTLCCPQTGLGLGFQDKGSYLESRKGKEGLEGLNCYNDHHHNNGNGTMLWPSSSSCQIMDPLGEELDMSIPSDSHHNLARNNDNQSGLWFTLRSFTNW